MKLIERKKNFIKVASILGACIVIVLVCYFIYQNNHFTYKYELLDDGTYAIQSVTNGKKVEKLIIPDSYKGKSVSRINSSVFEENLLLKEVVFPEGIKTIEAKAFYGCENLINLDLGLVETIGQEAFVNCGIQEIIIPNSVKRIGDSAFSNCANLQNITFNAIECQDFTSSSNIFKGCGEGNGISVKIGNEVKRIPANMFTSTYKTWDRSNETVYRQAYQYYVASQLSNGLFLGSSQNVMSFETWVLKQYGYTKYSKLNVINVVFLGESKCMEIGSKAFYNTMIDRVEFPKSLVKLEAQAIGECDNISKITFEDAQNWEVVGLDDVEIDFSDETNNVEIILGKYSNYNLQKIS